ncbi:hypothetical protein [Nonomuraea sp. NPDC002799]
MQAGVFCQQADGVAEQADGRLAAGAEQGVQDDGGLEGAEHLLVDTAGDRAEQVLARLPHRLGELPGQPGLDLPGAADALQELGVGQGRSEHRGGVERGVQEPAGVGVGEADETADHGDRHDVGDLGHELDGRALQGLGHEGVSEAGDAGFEGGHALGDQFGEDGLAVQGVQRRVGGGERLNTDITEGQSGREPCVVSVEQALHVGGEVLDPGRRLGHQLIGADREHPGTGNLPHRCLGAQPLVERIRIIDHVRVEQQLTVGPPWPEPRRRDRRAVAAPRHLTARLRLWTLRRTDADPVPSRTMGFRLPESSNIVD